MGRPQGKRMGTLRCSSFTRGMARMVQCPLATPSSCAHMQVTLSKSTVMLCRQGRLMIYIGKPSLLKVFLVLAGDWQEQAIAKSTVLFCGVRASSCAVQCATRFLSHVLVSEYRIWIPNI